MDVPVSSASFAPAQPNGVQIGPLVALLRRHIWLIGICTVLGAIGAYAYARTVPKSFTASSLIAVEGDRFAIPELQGALRSDSAPDPLPFVRTEVQAIASRDLMQVVVNKMHLADLPEFNGALRPPTLVQQAKEWLQSFMPQPPEVAGDNGPNEAVLGAALHALSVFQDNRSLVMQVSFTSYDPKLASDVVNMLITEYIASRANRRVAANVGANTAITERIDQVRVDLEGIEKQMRDLRTSGELVGVRAGSVGQQQVEELATAAARAGVDRAQLQTTFDRATVLAKQGSSDALASVLGSATISRLRDQESAASSKVAELSSRYGPVYPGVRSAQAELGSIQRQVRGETSRIVASLGTQLKVAKEHEADVQKQLEDARRIGVTAENSRAQLDQLEKEATTRRAMYQTLLERAQQTVAQPGGTETPDVRVVSRAAPPISPSSPNMKIALAAGGVAGLVLGCLLTLSRHRTMQQHRDEAELATATGLSVAASVPRATLRGGRQALLARIAAAPGGAEADSMRELRGRIARQGRAGVPRSAVFTGVSSSSDAARVAAAMARVAALDGDRVLLIDGNLAEPQIASLLVQASDGLLAALEGGDWRDLVTRDSATPLDILASVQPSQRSGALLGSAAFQNLLVETQAHYDLVVVAAAAGSTLDAATLAQRVDLVVLVASGSAGRQVQVVADRLGSMSRNPVTLVMAGQ